MILLFEEEVMKGENHAFEKKDKQYLFKNWTEDLFNKS